LTVQRIERDDDVAGNAQFGQQRLRRWDLVGLLGDVDVGEHQRGVSGERAQHLSSTAVVELVKAAAQRLAIQRDAALSRCGARHLKQGGMTAEDDLNRSRIKALEDVAHGSVSGRSTLCQSERSVQPAAMNVDEGDNAAIRVAAGHDGEDGKQQHMGQLIPSLTDRNLSA